MMLRDTDVGCRSASNTASLRDPQRYDRPVLEKPSFNWNVHDNCGTHCTQFQNVCGLLYLPDIFDLDYLSPKSDISNYVDVQDVKLTRIGDVFEVMHLNVHSLTKKIDTLKE